MAARWPGAVLPRARRHADGRRHREVNLEIGTPRALFRARVPFAGSLFRTNYDVTADGRRFLVNTVVEGAGATPITVVVNWSVGSRRSDCYRFLHRLSATKK